MNKPMMPLSASRIKTAQGCSAKFYYSYILGIPESSNFGAMRGGICHLVFEVLGHAKRRKLFKSVIKANDVYSSKSLHRLVLKHALKLGIADEENMSLMNDMMLNGLKYDFFGEDESKPTEAISEKSFDIEVNKDGKRYKIRGFLDKLFLYKKKKHALIRDF